MMIAECLAHAGLPVKGKAPWFVGWCGGTSRSISVEVPSELAKCLNIVPHTFVIVEPVPSNALPWAVSVEVEPVTESDWEVLEANAGMIEDVMLQQVHERSSKCRTPMCFTHPVHQQNIMLSPFYCCFRCMLWPLDKPSLCGCEDSLWCL